MDKSISMSKRYAKKGYGRRGREAPHTLGFVIRWKCGRIHGPIAFTSRKLCERSVDGSPGEPYKLSERDGVEKIPIPDRNRVLIIYPISSHLSATVRHKNLPNVCIDEC
jgi:hypothetical protein